MLMILEIPIKVEGEQTITLPAHAEILDVVTVAGIVRLIVKANIDGQLRSDRRVVMCGAGHPADPQIAEMRYAGTAVVGSLMFAVFVD